MSLEKYKENFQAVQGWADPKLFDTIGLIDKSGINRRGGIAEIGVHHGKFYILLNQVVNPLDTSYAIDVFGMQHLNIDKSEIGRAHV